MLVIRDLLEALRVAGLGRDCRSARTIPTRYPATRFPPRRWSGLRATEPGRSTTRFAVPSLPDQGGRTNPYFVDFYRTVAAELLGLEAREHTAQVPYEQRLDREERFRSGKLPVLFCSPTMELGVDIAELNVVNLRNIPADARQLCPAERARRSERAARARFCLLRHRQPARPIFLQAPGPDGRGRRHTAPHGSGQRRPDPRPCPRDLVGRDRPGLGTSLKDILDLSKYPELPLLDRVRDSLDHRGTATPGDGTGRAASWQRSRTSCAGSDWYTDTWLDEALNQALHRFDAACDRWRGLYRSAMAQRDLQNRIIGDASRKSTDKDRAKLLRHEAESQLELLTEATNIAQADFYSYRYFASEGFLPGYNFPRLPLSAYIPARRARQTRDEFVSRPRFLAISEFGPRSILYHEGSRYQINRVILPVEESDRLPTEQIKLCPECGYLHPVPDGPGPDCCDRCGAQLDPAMPSLFRLQNVSTKRREKINCDEEERLRLGYQIQTAVRFAEQGGRPSFRTAVVEHDGNRSRDPGVWPGGDALADQSGRKPAKGQGTARLRPRHRARLLGAERAGCRRG